MRAQRDLGKLLVVGLALGVVVVGALAVRGGSQDAGQGAATHAACETARPAAGGAVYLYVVDEVADVVSVFENGTLAASFRLPGHDEGVGWYTVCSGSAEPVAGGQAYCFVIDPFAHQVHVFRNAEYVGAEDLPTDGDEVP